MVEQHERHPEGDEREGVTGAPGESEENGPARTAPSVGEHERRDRGQVIGVGRMAEAEQQRDRERKADAASVAQLGDAVVEAEHAGQPPCVSGLPATGAAATTT